MCRRNWKRDLNAIVRSRTKKMLESVKAPATGMTDTASARSGQKPRGSLRMKTRTTAFYCIGVPPDGAEVSPPADIVLDACQIVPVVLMKKNRVPVVTL